MKKTVAVIMVFTFALSLLGGCKKAPVNVASEPSVSQPVMDNETTEDNGAEEVPDSNSGLDSLKPAGNPSEGFGNYSTYKNAAYDRITTAAEGSDTLSMAIGFSYLGVTLIDMSLLTLAMFTDDIKSSEAAMAMLGMEGVKITGSGNDYTITYKDSEGAVIKQTCTYDPGKDQLSSMIYDADGKTTMFFEYAFLGDAYAAQYYYPSDEAYEVIRAYFDKDNIAAFGILTASEEPASILGESGYNEEFVKNDQSYIILADGKLTAFDNGEVTTN